MKRHPLLFSAGFVVVFVLASLALWAIQGDVLWTARRLITTSLALAIVGLAALS